MLAKRTQVMKPSKILMLASRAKEMIAAGQDVVSLTVGEPDWPTFENIKQAGIQAISNNKSFYQPPNGIPDLRKAIAEQTTKDLGIKYSPADVTVTAGAKFILFSALQTLVDPNDEVLLLAPYWASYSTMVELAQGVPKVVVCEESNNFKVTAKQLRESINSKTKILLLNSPSNPTGQVYSRTELAEIAQVLRDNPKIVVISDDIYNRLYFHGDLAPHILQVAPDLRDRVVVMNGASKSYAMTGWRLGWALAAKPIIEMMTNYQSQTVSCAVAATQYAGLEAVLNSEPSVRKTVQTLIERKKKILSELEKVPGVRAFAPEGAFYIWLDVRGWIGKSFEGVRLVDSEVLAATLLEKKLVAVVPGLEFGLDGYLRLSFACSPENATKAVSRMLEFQKSLKN